MACRLLLRAAVPLCLCLLLTLSLSLKEARVQVITESNASAIVTGEWMLEFYAPWCPACKRFEPVWSEFGQWAKDLDIRVAKVDVTAESGLSGRFLVTALPTIYHVKDNVFRLYAGRRAMDDLMTYVEDQKWRDNKPLTWWRSPSSPIMMLLGTTFKVSMTLRDVHRSMTEIYGIPTWAAYGLFAVFTVVIGVAIGAVIVFVADLVLGRRGNSKQIDQKSGQKEVIDHDSDNGSEKPASDEDAAGLVMRRKVKASAD